MKKNQKTNVISKVEIAQINENSDVQPTNELLTNLLAIGITDKIKEKSGKSIFKKEFNNKTDRTKCRTKFLNSISLYLLHKGHGKIELAEEKLNDAKTIAQYYYLAEDNFNDAKDYCTDNMDDNKKALIGLFINELNPKELVSA